jgi:hypothetical protein
MAAVVQVEVVVLADMSYPPVTVKSVHRYSEFSTVFHRYMSTAVPVPSGTCAVEIFHSLQGVSSGLGTAVATSVEVL